MTYCQSCGMPLNKDPKGGGSNSDGSLSTKYCSLCYENGEYFYTGTDAKEYQKFVMDNMVEEGWKRPIAWLFTRGIPKLERWRG